MKDEVKGYCQHENITTIETENNKVDFKVRSQNKVEVSLIPDEVRDQCTVPVQIWLAYYEKK